MGDSASTRIDALRPSVEGTSDLAMANRAGFREARDAAAQIASEHDVIAAELLEALKALVHGCRHWQNQNCPELAAARAAIAKTEAV